MDAQWLHLDPFQTGVVSRADFCVYACVVPHPEGDGRIDVGFKRLFDLVRPKRSLNATIVCQLVPRIFVICRGYVCPACDSIRQYALKNMGLVNAKIFGHLILDAVKARVGAHATPLGQVLWRFLTTARLRTLTHIRVI